MPASARITTLEMLNIALPMMLANITTPLIGLVGIGVIGQLGEAHLLGAVAISGVIFDILYLVFMFLRMSTVALIAQAVGAADRVEQEAVLFRSVFLGSACGVVLLMLQAPIGWIAFSAAGASVEVTRAAETYFAIRIWSSPFVLANFALLGWLTGLGRAKLALALQVIINVINAAATYFLVLVLHYGIVGVAASAVIGEFCGVVFGLLLVLRMTKIMDGLSSRLIFDRSKLIRLFAINRDIMVRTVAILAALAFFSSQGARRGDVVLAANTVLLNLVTFGAFFLDGFASAAEQLGGRSVGERDLKRFSYAANLALRWSAGFGLLSAAIMMLGGGWVVDLITPNAEVRDMARQYLPYAALALATGSFAFAYDGIFIGATATDMLRNLMIVALGIFIAVWWLTWSLGNTGLWLSLCALLGGRGLLQALAMPRLKARTFSEAAKATRVA